MPFEEHKYNHLSTNFHAISNQQFFENKHLYRPEKTRHISKYITKDITDDDELKDLKKEIIDLEIKIGNLDEEYYNSSDRKVWQVYEDFKVELEQKKKEFNKKLNVLSYKTITDSRIWFASRELSKIKPASDFEQDYNDELKFLQRYLDRKQMDTGEICYLKQNFVTIWLVTVDELKKLNLMELYHLFYDNFLEQVEDHL